LEANQCVTYISLSRLAIDTRELQVRHNLGCEAELGGISRRPEG